MKQLTRLQWIALIGMVAIGLLGGIGVSLLASQTGGIESELQSHLSAFKTLTGRRYFPSEENINTLQANNQALKEALEAFNQHIATPGTGLRTVIEKDPVQFKQQMSADLRGLAALAAKNSVRIEVTATDFGFSAYQKSNPPRKATVPLGKELIGIHEVATALFNAQISNLTSVRRALIEGGLGGTPGETLKASITTPPGAPYTVYPLEFEFIGSEKSIQAALAEIAKAPDLLIVRFLLLKSKRPTPPNTGDLAKAVEASVTSSASGKKPTFVVAMGDDPIQVRIRIDLIDWTSVTDGKTALVPAQAPAPASAPTPKP